MFCVGPHFRTGAPHFAKLFCRRLSATFYKRDVLRLVWTTGTCGKCMRLRRLMLEQGRQLCLHPSVQSVHGGNLSSIALARYRVGTSPLSKTSADRLNAQVFAPDVFRCLEMFQAELRAVQTHLCFWLNLVK
eukprot:s999_g8.t1